MSTLPGLTEIERAAVLVHALIPPTPQFEWPLLSVRCGCTLIVKHENHTSVGAFKVRGGIVYMDTLMRTQPDVPGIVSATRGNHGQSLAFAAGRYNIPVAIVVPHGNSTEKNAAMRALGADVIEEGHDFQAAVEVAARIATERGWHRVPSYDPLLVRGVATYSLELFREHPDIHTMYVPIGLGSGISGAIAARNALGLDTRIVGVVSTGAPAYALSFHAGEPVAHDVTTVLADGMSCRVPVPAALDVILAGADRIVEVSDDDIAAAMRAYFTDTHNVAEGAGAAALAAVIQERDLVAGRKIAVVLSGGNVDKSVFAGLLAM
ncbi:MAG: threonine dehydratase [Gemmatimonadota bacterium]|nr:threonine dehydratase [Gemmatimonadota bacterium]